MRKKIKGRFWQMFTLMLGLLLLAACAPAAPKAAPGAEPAKLTPKRGGVLAYPGVTQAVDLDPFKIASAGERRAVGPIYDLLVTFRYEPGFNYAIDWEVVPRGLAEGWEQPNDNTYVFHLRKGVKWHDGVDFTADDVVFTYEYIRDPKNASPLRRLLTAADKIEKVDSYTIRITTSAPSPYLLRNLADLNMMIVPKHVKDRGDSFAKVAIGTGPFKLKSFDPKSTSEFVRNDSYWQEGKPYLDGLVVHWALDASARLAAFTARKLDIWSEPDKVQAESIMKLMPDLQVERVTPAYGDALIMQLGKPPFNDVRVRRALHLAVDRQVMVKTVGWGEGVINPPGMPGHMKGWAIPQEELLKMPGYRQPKDDDIAEAKRLLAEAGYPGGFKTTVLFDPNRTTEPRFVEPLATSISKVGVQMELRGKPTAENVKDLRDGNYETALDFTADNKPMARQAGYMHSKGANNTFGLNDPKLDDLIDKLTYTMKVDEQKRLWLELQRYLLEQVYFIPTIEIPAYKLRQPWVHDFVPHVSVSPFVDSAQAPIVWLDVEKMPADRR